MTPLRRFFHRLYNLLRPAPAESDLTRELASHLTLLEDDFQRQGLTPAQARLAARRAFGGVEVTKEHHRTARSFVWLDDARRDLHYAARTFGRNPAFTVAVVLTLALGIGANTAIFSAVNAILLRPLPYQEADRLVNIIENIPGEESIGGAPVRTATMNVADLPEWRRQTTTLSHLALHGGPASMTLAGGELAVRLQGVRVSAVMFAMLGVQPVLGRLFGPDEDTTGAAHVVILSHSAWVSHFMSDLHVIGRPVTLDETTYVVVGVMPRTFVLPGIWEAQTQFWIPFTLTASPGGIQRTPVIARLKQGVTLEAATAEAETIAAAFRGETPSDRDAAVSAPRRIEIVPVKDELVAPIRNALLVFVVAVGLVLLIACLNVTTLFIARSQSREREIAIRCAVGAGRSRVLRQLLTESLSLALLGGIAGCVLAFVGTQLLDAVAQRPFRLDLVQANATGNAIPRLSEITIDHSVLLYSLTLTLLTGVLCGLGPALRVPPSSHIPGVAAWRNGATSCAIKFTSARTLMVIGQVGFAMVLLLGAGLLIRSFVKLVTVDLGYNPANVLTFQLPQAPLQYPRDVTKQPQQTAFAEELVTRLQSTRGVQAVGFTNALPMVQGRFVLSLKARPGDREASLPGGSVLIVSADYLRAMGIRVIAGRGLDESDRRGAARALLINRRLARDYFAGADPIGKTLYFWGPNQGEIVGVIEDTRHFSLDADPGPQMLMDAAHAVGLYAFPGGVYFAVRTELETAQLVPHIRGLVGQLDPGMTIDNIATMDQIVSHSIVNPRAAATLLGILAAIALALATIGIYGVLAYVVTARTREIGIRMALGAHRSEAIGLVLRHSVVVTAAGIVLGLAGAATVTRYLRGMLFGLTPLDGSTFIAASVLFAVVAAVASYLPARRATNIDPMLALRCE